MLGAAGPALPLVRGVSFVHRLSWVVAALLVVSSAAGLVFGRKGLYDAQASTLPALLGQDALALLFGVPLLVWSAVQATRGSARAYLCWMGALFYIAYFWYFYVLGIRFSALFPVHIALVSMSMYGALYLLFALDLPALAARFDHRMPVRTTAAFLIVTALAFVALWMGAVFTALTAGEPLDAVTRLVVAVDGVVLLPLSFFGGIWLWTRQPLGYALAGMLLVKVVATFLTLVATTVVSVSWGQTVNLVESAMYSVGLVVATALLAGCLRSVK